ncbi:MULTISPECIES: GspH/FimT family protein [Legionella]|uniref:Type II secretion system protein H n=1 Tax=Legionella maceachernii TaxID=466 RepID=A0A0W0WEN4_9GAMM|nr:GspH/FimT family protein [Legionella maceachernii]KTD30675.1 Tfp type 4 fimbrial pilin like signal peptide protein domain protein [Legionella maceachernii]SJZ80527.1 type IV fimbrial biogenesis protein FimT [Legionella maceachernii]SUP02827.1 Tfp pilus assembly protein FimT [Legionella maceachernii]
MVRNSGLTLVELLTTLMIMSIVFTFCLPLGFSNNEKNQLQVLEHEISTAIRYTRNKALLHHLPLILTPLPNSVDWSEGMILFVDNKNHHYTERDTMIHQWNWLKKGIRVSWKGFYSKNYLLFASDINRLASSGHFTLQDSKGESVKLVINRLGRMSRQTQ